MDTSFIKGIVVPMVTPVDKEDCIDETRLRKQVDYVINGGVHGILAFGSNGEFYMFDQEEMKNAFAIIRDQNKGRVPLFFGIGMISTKKCVALAKMAEEMGAQGISVLQPMYLKPTNEEVLQHFTTIAAAVPNTPVLIYNNPGRAGYTIPLDVMYKLAHEVPNIVGMKDTSGDMTQTMEFIRMNRDVDFKVLGGKDTMVYATLCHGGVGAVCSTANYMPELVMPIYNKFVAGDIKGSMEAQFTMNPVRLAMDKASFPVAAKDMAVMRGIDVGEPVHPSLATAPDSKAYEIMATKMKEAGLL